MTRMCIHPFHFTYADVSLQVRRCHLLLSAAILGLNTLVSARWPCRSVHIEAHPSLAYTSGQSGSVASATTNVCRSPASTLVSCAAGAGTCSKRRSLMSLPALPNCPARSRWTPEWCLYALYYQRRLPVPTRMAREPHRRRCNLPAWPTSGQGQSRLAGRYLLYAPYTADKCADRATGLGGSA
jgi:hypothetical protein